MNQCIQFMHFLIYHAQCYGVCCCYSNADGAAAGGGGWADFTNFETAFLSAGGGASSSGGFVATTSIGSNKKEVSRETGLRKHVLYMTAHDSFFCFCQSCIYRQVKGLKEESN